MNQVIIFCKDPWGTQPVKSRLGKQIGNQKARDLYESFLKLLIEKLQFKPEFEMVLSVASQPTVEFQKTFGAFAIEVQIDGDLGHRLTDSLLKHLAQQQKVLITGSDSPLISIESLQICFQKLDTSDVVFGPSTDGGFYAVGCRSFSQKAFDGVRWSTQYTLQDALKGCQQENLQTSLGLENFDIDTQEDLQKLKKELLSKNLEAHEKQLLEILP